MDVREPPVEPTPRPRVAAVVALVLLAVGAALGSVRLGRALVGLDPRALRATLALDDAARIDRELERSEAADGYAPGDLRALRDAVARHVPPDGEVHVRSTGARAPAAVARIGLLTFPVRFVQLAALDPSRRPPRDVFLLDLEPLPRARLEGWLELVAERPSWRLWRGRGTSAGRADADEGAR